MVPCLHQGFPGDALYLGEVHHHALLRRALGGDNVPAESNLKGVAVAVQVPALAVMAGDAMAGVELEPARDEHGRGCADEGRDYSTGTVPARRGSPSMPASKSTPHR